MDDGLDAVRALLPGVRLTPGARLGGGERSSVERVRARHPEGETTSLVVKRYHAAGEGWVRESAALAVLPTGAGGPRLVVAGGPGPADGPIVVTADEGEGPSVADALLGDDPAAAGRALVDWAEALARLHLATRDLRADFRRELAAREGDAHVADAPTAARLEEAVRLLERQCGGLGIRVPDGAFDELRGLGRRLGGDGTAALTPADVCPDNNVRTADGLVLLDFEDAQWRHVAWDVAYLRVPWPSCWCCWRLPDEAVAEAIAAYREVVATGFPAVADPEFDRQLDAAEVGWALATAALSLDNALAGDPPIRAPGPSPARRIRVLHRLGRAAARAELPAAAELAARLVAELTGRWAAPPLALAPAFRESGAGRSVGS